jgi:uncharacterized Zn-binding protein involved in type VI secretion
MRPAARQGDHHTCPASTGTTPHVGGPISTGSPDVWIGGAPAARVGDIALCNGPPDVIVGGSRGVYINGRPAARMGDPTAHGGVIVQGCPTVLIGDFGAVGLASRGVAGLPRTRLPATPASPRQVTVLDAAVPDIGTWKLLPTAPVLVQRGLEVLKAFRHGPVSGLSALLGTLGTEALIDAASEKLGDGAGWLLGKLGASPELCDAAEAFVEGLVWTAAHTIEVKGMTVSAWGSYMASNLIEAAVAGGWEGWDNCPIGDPAPAVPGSATTGCAQPVPSDCTAQMEGLLRTFRPKVYQNPEDVPGVSLEELLPRCRVVTSSGEVLRLSAGDLLGSFAEVTAGKTGAIEMNARALVGVSFTPTMYGRVIWLGEDKFALEYAFIRVASWLPNRHLEDHLLLHAGDGEKVVLYVKYKEGQFVLTSGRFGGHGKPYECPGEDAEAGAASGMLLDGQRPLVFVANGSHACAPTPGRRFASKFGPFGAVDWFPDRDQKNLREHRLVTAADPKVRAAVYERSFRWGEYPEDDSRPAVWDDVFPLPETTGLTVEVP